MTTHVRQQIRDEIVTAVTGLTTTGANVYKSRTLALDVTPALIVFTGSEQIDEEEGRIAKVQFRNLEMIIVGRVKLLSLIDDKLDTIAKEVEIAVLGAIYTVITGIDLVSIDVDIDTDGTEQPVGEITLTFAVPYLTRDGVPTETT